jgi:S1-C subfamily serine protease
MLIAVAAGAIGCQPVYKPTNAARRVSFSERQTLFLTDHQRALRQTYMVFSTDGEPRISIDLRTGDVSFTSSGRTKISQGLAVVLERDGYLLTAEHVLGKTNYVYGRFDGTPQFRPLRVVYARRTSSHAEVAVIKVDGPLEAPPARGDVPVSGEAAFAVALFREDDQLGGSLGLTGGTVLRTRPDPAGSGTLLVDHDLPLWQGDSGGPLFSATGSLIGITSGYELTWRGLGWTYRKLSFLPDWKQIQALIETDRGANHPPPIRRSCAAGRP